MTDRPCPCGHGPDLACLNGLIYGPCGTEGCDTPCADTWGRCKGLDGCCDPENEPDDPPRRCESEACDEYDGIHSYGDGCAMARQA